MEKRVNYFYLPEKYHSAHDYCEFVLLQFEEFIISDKFQKLREQTIVIPEKLRDDYALYKGEILDFLESNNLTIEYNSIIVNHLLNALIIDTCYFLQEGFLCSLKMRLSVSFTLFRKPFFESLIILMRLLTEQNFLEKFNLDEKFDPTNLSNALKKEYLETLNFTLFELYQVDDLYDYLFNKNYEDNLYNISNHAIHLHTNKNPVIQTQRQNLNFIFSGREEIEAQWEYIYTIIPMLLTFLIDIAELCVMTYTANPFEIFDERFKNRYSMRIQLGVK